MNLASYHFQGYMHNQNQITWHGLFLLLALSKISQKLVTIKTPRNALNMLDHINERTIAKIIWLIFVYVGGVDQYVSPAYVPMEDLMVVNEQSMD